MGHGQTAHVAWGFYARQQTDTLRIESHGACALSHEASLDLILSLIERGLPVDAEDVDRCRRTAGRRERARNSLVLRLAVTVESDMRSRGPVDPETAAAISASLAREAERDARILSLDAQGYASHEIAARVGMDAPAIRQRLSRRSKALMAA